MYCVTSVCAVRLVACVWPEGEQATAVNEVTIWYEVMANYKWNV